LRESKIDEEGRERELKAKRKMQRKMKRSD
jgi:hypothetical protein